jgi:hypothetical protein
MILRAIAIWVVLLILAILIAGGKIAYIIPRAGEHAGQIIGTLVFCPVIFAVTYFSICWINPTGLQNAFTVGIIWVLLTMAFEFLAGHYLFGNSWEKLFSEYEIWNGRLWVLILVTNLISPVMAAKFRMKSNF